MIARLQQLWTLVVAASSLASLALSAQRAHYFLGVLIAAIISLGYSIIIAAELAMLMMVASEATRPPLRSIVRAWSREIAMAPRIFYWRQPFCSKVYPDRIANHSGGPAVLLVHGFLCNRGFWNPWMKRLSGEKISFLAINLEPAFCSISKLCQQIEDAVAVLQSATGARPMVVAHSMGGLAVRYWLHQHVAEDRVAHIITIGTPHRGTWLARFSRSANVREMAVDSEWIQSLSASSSAARNALFTCFYSNCDNAVFPSENATLEGASNRLIDGAGHVDLAFRAEVMDEVIEQIHRMGRLEGD